VANTTLTKAIGYLVFIGGVLLYVYLYGTFLKDILDAPDGKRPDLNNANVQLASGIGGALGGVFAAAFGIQRQDPKVDEKKLNVGTTLTPGAPWVTGVSIVAYFVVGLGILAVSRANSAEAPQEIQTTATVFAGYLAAIFFATLTGPGKTPGA
jgi:hypothetical protein